MAIDDKIILLEPKLRTVNVAITLPSNSYARSQVEKAVRLNLGVEITKPDVAHLIIAPSSPLPESRDGLWWLGIPSIAKKKSVKPPRKPAGKNGDLPFIIDRSHPLLERIELPGVRWTESRAIEYDVRPLIVRGDSVLLGQLKGTDTTAFLMNIDLRKSSITGSPDWPILIKNLIELRRDALPGLREWNYHSNQEVRFRLPAESANRDSLLQLVRGDETRHIARTQLVRFSSPTKPGIYELRDGDTSLGKFAVVFGDRRESDLSAMSTGRLPRLSDDGDSGFFLDKPLSPLLLALIVASLAALFFDWLVLKSKRPSPTADDGPKES